MNVYSFINEWHLQTPVQSVHTHSLLVQHYGLPNEAPVVISLECWNIVNVTRCVLEV